VRDYASHPYITKDKIIVLFIIIDRAGEDKKFSAEK
jgi:hypothetical protein